MLLDTYWNDPSIDNLLALPAEERASQIATKLQVCIYSVSYSHTYTLTITLL